MKNVIIKSLIIVAVFACFTTPSFAQSQFISKGSIEKMDKSQLKAAKKEAKEILKEIKAKEKECQELLSESCPEQIKARRLEELNALINKYNAFVPFYGIETYKSQFIEHLGKGTLQQKQSESNNEDVVLTVSSDGPLKDEKSRLISEDESPKEHANQLKSSSKDEIILTVTSDGPTKNVAVTNALRTAIEQAYGAFVSANTTILNDELVKDEIVTVTNGSIKEYKEIASAQTENGSYNVTLSATVSLPNLITYAKNHGSECEFAGNTFGMEMKLFNLQKENELKALYNLIPWITDLAKNKMKWEILVKEPKVTEFKFEKTIFSEPEYKKGGAWDKLPYNYERASGRISLRDVDYSRDYGSVGYDLSDISDVDIRGLLNHSTVRKDGLPSVEKDDSVLSVLDSMPDGQYVNVRFVIRWVPIDSKESTMWNLISEKIKLINIDSKSWQHYRDLGLKVSLMPYGPIEDTPYFRNSEKEICLWFDTLMDAMNEVKNNFVIIDNTGQISDFYPLLISDFYDADKSFNSDVYSYSEMLTDDERSAYRDEKLRKIGVTVQKLETYGGGTNSLQRWSMWDRVYSFPGKIIKFMEQDYHPDIYIGGKGLFSRLFFVQYMGQRRSPDDENKYRDKECPSWIVDTLIPMSEIGKYSSFKIERK
jgi:hypothetical protein